VRPTTHQNGVKKERLMKINKGLLNSEITFKYYPLCYFFIFAASNGIMAYLDVPFQIKLWVGLLGILTPLIIAFKVAVKVPENEIPIFQKELLEGPLKWWMFVLVLGLSVFTRLYHLTTLSGWPLPDEGMESYYSINFLHNWNEPFFHSYAQIPPLFCWLLALFYKCISPSLFSFWLFPALVSIVIILLIYPFARVFLSKSFSFMLLLIFSLNYWFLYTGRNCTNLSILLFWEVLSFGFLGLFLRHPVLAVREKALLILGILAGTGFLTAIAWPVVAALMILAVFLTTAVENESGIKKAILFLGPIIIFLSYFIYEALNEGYGQHINSQLAVPLGESWMAQLVERFSYVTSIFWGNSNPFCGPVWGGMLNPIEGGLFFTGVVECYQTRKSGFCRWILLGLGLFLLPGVVTNSFDIFRILPLAPLLGIVSCMGLSVLVEKISKRKWALVVTLMALSSGINLYHLLGPYHQFWGTANPVCALIKRFELRDAYEILDRTQNKFGTGAVLLELRGDSSDQTLNDTVYAFDACRNRDLSFENVHWVAFIVPVDYLPFLAVKFPKGKWYRLHSGLSQNGIGLMLGVIPVDVDTRETTRKWFNADRALQPATDQIVSIKVGPSQKRVLGLIFESRDLMKNDAFLESCFWEKVMFHRKAQGDSEGVLDALQNALALGYPLPRYLEGTKILKMSLKK
jgi:4-amino-4-deoxy-L-arabinose transferase-like glycosyltransferase